MPNFSGSLGITVELAEKPVSCSANLLKTLSRVLSYISVCTATPKDPTLGGVLNPVSFSQQFPKSHFSHNRKFWCAAIVETQR
jgi:hypothetical protein